MIRIIRVFPRRTAATPDDDLVRVNTPPGFFDEADEVRVSVAFTWDIPRAEWLARQWKPVAPVSIGGPAFNAPGGDFVPGMYMKRGYVITSRGCMNRCWFCSVPSREGGILRELPVTDGWIVTDDNLLACSPSHVEAVFAMLRRQPRRPEFVGGLEAKLLTPDMAVALRSLNPRSMYYAYDTPDDRDPLVQAGRYLAAAGFRREWHVSRCYVLVGYKGDTFEKAERRLHQAWEAGFFPFAMLYRDGSGKHSNEWKKFQSEWINPLATVRKLKTINNQ
ncbi:MAG: hypothetical protein LBP56_00190 [Odoribacteraceae bacterium]|jgi:hypothetical protein|nr:hypothetical protein [Odoribacteraceae bacterium]